MIKILFICHGNICRSTMSEYVMKYLIDQAGLASEFYIDSAATSREEIGNGVHHGTRQKLKEVGIPCGNHRARQMMRRDYEEFDYIIGMDAWNIRNIMRIIGLDPEKKVSMLLDFTDHPGTRNKLKSEGIPCGNHRARHMEKSDYNEFDYIIGMDSANIRNIGRIVGNDRDGKVYKLLQFAGEERDIADPWYTGNFDATYDDVLKGCTALLNEILDAEKFTKEN